MTKPLPSPTLRPRTLHPFRGVQLKALLLSAAFVGTALVGCGEPEREAAAPWDGGGGAGLGGQPNVISVGNCSEETDDERTCKVYHEKASGVTSCFNGIQYCDAGTWSDCIDPSNDPRVQ